MTEQAVLFISRYKAEIFYSTFAVVSFLIIFYTIMGIVMFTYFLKYKQVLYSAEKLLKELYKAEPRVDGFIEFRDTVRAIRKIDKSQGGLNYLRTLSDHCKPEILIMKSLYKQAIEEDTDMSLILKMLTKDLNAKIGLLDDLTIKEEVEV